LGVITEGGVVEGVRCVLLGDGRDPFLEAFTLVVAGGLLKLEGHFAVELVGIGSIGLGVFGCDLVLDFLCCNEESQDLVEGSGHAEIRGPRDECPVGRWGCAGWVDDGRGDTGSCRAASEVGDVAEVGGTTPAEAAFPWGESSQKGGVGVGVSELVSRALIEVEDLREQLAVGGVERGGVAAY
jgi:hypothetical protein